MKVLVLPGNSSEVHWMSGVRGDRVCGDRVRMEARLGRGGDTAAVSEGHHADRKCPSPGKRHAVKRHHHKHNLKHRYDFLQTLGKGTYGKVKKAVDRTGRLVRPRTL